MALHREEQRRHRAQLITSSCTHTQEASLPSERRTPCETRCCTPSITVPVFPLPPSPPTPPHDPTQVPTVLPTPPMPPLPDDEEVNTVKVQHHGR